MDTLIKTDKVAESCSETGLAAWIQIVRVYEKMQHHADAHLDCYDLTPAQYDVLAQLQAAPGINQQTLAERLMVTKGNICGLIDRMEKRKLVERRADPDDRRLNLLYLTATGEQVAAEAIPAYGRFIREHMSALTSDEQLSLGALLKRLDSYLTTHP